MVVAKETLAVVFEARDKLTGAVKGIGTKVKASVMSGIVAPFKAAKKVVTALTSSIGALGAIVGVGLSINGIRNFAKEISGLASSADEIRSKFEVVFGEATGDIDQFVEGISDRIGRGRTELERSLSSFQDIFVPLGFANDQAAELSKTLTQVSIDLASFNETSDATALNSLQSGIVGNTEALRRYGIAINQSRIEQEALNLGLIQSKGELDAQTKALTIATLIVKDSEAALGDAERTSDSFANTVKNLRAQLNGVKIELGREFNTQLLALIESVGGVEGVVRLARIGFEALQKAALGFVNFVRTQGIPIVEDLLRLLQGLAKLTQQDDLAVAVGDLLNSEVFRASELNTELQEQTRLLEQIQAARARITDLALEQGVDPAFAPAQLFDPAGVDPAVDFTSDQQLAEVQNRIAAIRQELEGLGLGDAANAFFGSGENQFAAGFDEAAVAADGYKASLSGVVEEQARLAEQQRIQNEVFQGFTSIAEVNASLQDQFTLSTREQLRELDAWRAQMEGVIQALSVTTVSNKEIEQALKAVNRVYEEQREELRANTAEMSIYQEAAVKATRAIVGVSAEATKEFQTQRMEISETGQVVQSGLVAGFNAITPAIERSDNAASNFVSTLARAVAQTLLLKAINAGTATLFSQPSGVGGGTVPAFQTGGIVTRPTIAAIGEGGQNEAVVPLPNGRAIPVEFGGGGGGPGGRFELKPEINIRALDSRDVAQSLNDSGDAIVEVLMDKFMENPNFRRLVTEGSEF